MAGTGPGSAGGYHYRGTPPWEHVIDSRQLREMEARLTELEKTKEQRIKELEAELESLKR